jgi:hypothetical protein
MVMHLFSYAGILSREFTGSRVVKKVIIKYKFSKMRVENIYKTLSLQIKLIKFKTDIF